MRSGYYTKLPNAISLLRGLLSPILLFLPQPYLLIFFILLALSDALDGYLARRMGAITELGKVLDPAADKLMLLFGLFVSVYSLQNLPEWFLYLTLSRDLFLLVGGLIILVRTGSVPSARLTGKGFTFSTALLVFFSLLEHGNKPFLWMSTFLLFVSWLDYTIAGTKKLRNQTFSLS